MDPLEPADRQLLERLLALREDFHALAAESHRHYLDLYAWSTRPHIQAYLHFHRAHTAHTQDRDARDALLSIMNSADDPTEKRRAATTLLRALRNLTPTPTPTSRRREPEAPTPPPPSCTPTGPAPARASPFPATPDPSASGFLKDLLPTLVREIAGDPAPRRGDPIQKNPAHAAPGPFEHPRAAPPPPDHHPDRSPCRDPTSG